MIHLHLPSGIYVEMTPAQVTFRRNRFTVAVSTEVFVEAMAEAEEKGSKTKNVVFLDHRWPRKEFLVLGRIAEALEWCYECNSKGTYRSDNDDNGRPVYELCPHCDGGHVVIGTRGAEAEIEALTKVVEERKASA